MSLRSRCVAALVLAAMLAACGEAPPPAESPRAAASPAASAPPAPAAPPAVPETAVLDRFQVGEHVYVRSLLVEPARKALWVGTSTGVLEIDLDTHRVRRTLTREHGLANEYVFGVGLDRLGYKWFGTNAGGVSRHRDGEWKTFFPMHGLADYWVYTFVQQRGGPFWIGTWEGASKVDLDTLTFTNYRKELVNEWVYGLAVDSRDRVWFGTEGGVSRFDGQHWDHWTHADGMGAANAQGLPASQNTGLGTRSRHDLSILAGGAETYNPNYVFAVHVAADDTVWAGTWGGGVARYDGTRWTNLTVADGLAGNVVYSIAQEPSGTLWFGTNHGLSRYDGKRWRSYGRADGLEGDHVYAIVVAPNGDVWAGTKGGAARLGRPGAQSSPGR